MNALCDFDGLLFEALAVNLRWGDLVEDFLFSGTPEEKTRRKDAGFFRDHNFDYAR